METKQTNSDLERLNGVEEHFERMGSCSDTSFDFCWDVEKNMSAENLSAEGSFSDFDLCDEFDVCSVPETIKSSKADSLGSIFESESDETKHSDYIIRTISSIDIENRGSNLEAQIEELLNVEKQMRLVGDVDGTTNAATDVLQLCFDARDWRLLIEQIVILSKRRGQFKQTIKAVVQQAMQYIDQTPDLNTKIELIKTLNSVSAGKIHVEIERARFIKKLAKIMEEHGLVSDAADLMQEVAVETIDSMAKTEKIAFILEQVRLCLDCQDYLHAQLHSRKINPRVFRSDTFKGKKRLDGEKIVEEAPADIPSLSELKLIYNQLMNRHCSYKNGYPDKPRRYIYVNGIRFVMEDDLPAFGRFFHGQNLSHCMRTSKHHFRHLLLPIQPRHQKRNKC